LIVYIRKTLWKRASEEEWERVTLCKYPGESREGLGLPSSSARKKVRHQINILERGPRSSERQEGSKPREEFSAGKLE